MHGIRHPFGPGINGVAWNSHLVVLKKEKKLHLNTFLEVRHVIKNLISQQNGSNNLNKTK